jgi:lysophospholipase L1-like esterase
MPSKGLRKRITIALVSTVVAIGGVEAFLQGLVWLFQISDRARYRECGDCPWVYEPVPGRKDINSLGLRGPEVSAKASGDVFRILLLGDSVAHGFGVADADTFARKLERSLARKRPVEVLNAAVDGYSPFNQARLFEQRLAELRPNLVLVQTCFNDVVDPRLHWYAWQGIQRQLDPEAIPPDQLSANQARSAPAWRLYETPWLRPLILNRLIVRALIERHARTVGISVGQRVHGRFWPTYVTGEMPFTIEPFLQSESPAMKWFASQHQRTLRRAGEIGARVAFLIAPLAYQLDASYPFRPQDAILAFCKREGIACLDLLPALQADGAQDLYLQGSAGDVALLDIWHFSPRGHGIVAETTAFFLESAGLIEKTAPRL